MCGVISICTEALVSPETDKKIPHTSIVSPRFIEIYQISVLG